MSKYFKFSLLMFSFLFISIGLSSSALSQGFEESGPISVFAVVPEAPGANCPNGGNIIASGLDTNGNGFLNFKEVRYLGYFCDGAPGGQGPQGPQGLMGAEGSTGDSGPNGDPGIAGTQGLAGPQGPIGPEGNQGPAGAQGPDGIAGLKGQEGPKGKMGEDGVAGLSCWDANGNGIGDPAEDINSDGNYNSLDCIGPVGLQGPQGDQGPTGAAGPQGDQGPQGIVGPDGPQGDAGAKGETGDQGSAGAAAFSGLVEESQDQPSCPNGESGKVLDYGVDLNNNGSLEESEKDGSFDFCEGMDGTVGAQGPQGPAGTEFPTGYSTGIGTATCTDECTYFAVCNANDIAVSGTCGVNPTIGTGYATIDLIYAGRDPNDPRTYKCKVEADPFTNGNETIYISAFCIPGIPTKTVFVTSSTTNGTLSGITGANARCQSAADSAGLTGTFKAWLSDNTSNPASSFTRSTGPYVLVDGTQIAEDWDDLTDGTLDNPINLSESGATITGGTWTNTSTNGTLIDGTQDCSNWGNTLGSSTPGDTTTADSTWTDVEITLPCAFGLRLYCFEQ